MMGFSSSLRTSQVPLSWDYGSQHRDHPSLLVSPTSHSLGPIFCPTIMILLFSINDHRIRLYSLPTPPVNHAKMHYFKVTNELRAWKNKFHGDYIVRKIILESFILVLSPSHTSKTTPYLCRQLLTWFFFYIISENILMFSLLSLSFLFIYYFLF